MCPVTLDAGAAGSRHYSMETPTPTGGHVYQRPTSQHNCHRGPRAGSAIVLEATASDRLQGQYIKPAGSPAKLCLEFLLARCSTHILASLHFTCNDKLLLFATETFQLSNDRRHHKPLNPVAGMQSSDVQYSETCDKETTFQQGFARHNTPYSSVPHKLQHCNTECSCQQVPLGPVACSAGAVDSIKICVGPAGHGCCDGGAGSQKWLDQVVE